MSFLLRKLSEVFPVVLRVMCIIRTRDVKPHPSSKWNLGNSSEDLTGDEVPQVTRVLGLAHGGGRHLVNRLRLAKLTVQQQITWKPWPLNPRKCLIPSACRWALSMSLLHWELGPLNCYWWPDCREGQMSMVHAAWPTAPAKHQLWDPFNCRGQALAIQRCLGGEGQQSLFHKEKAQHWCSHPRSAIQLLRLLGRTLYWNRI